MASSSITSWQIDGETTETVTDFIFLGSKITADSDWSQVKASACNAGDLGSIPGSGSSPGEGNGNPLQYSCLENPMGGGAWWATIHRVTKSRTRLSDFTFTFILLLGRKTMTNLDSILKSRDITLPIKIHLVKAMVLPVVIYVCESWTIEKAESQRIDVFEL